MHTNLAQELLDAIRRQDVKLSSSRPAPSITIPNAPWPFILPTLLFTTPESASLNAEVIVIRSPAAVGKTTFARYLASTARQPLLDLAKTRVATHSLSGILAQEVLGFNDPIDAFHRGEYALVVDALDEGRMVSTEASWEAFLVTTWQLLCGNRSVTSRPKLILFGRNEAVEIVKLSLELQDPAPTVSYLSLDFFDRDAAADVIREHAKAAGGTVHPHWDGVIDAYFESIAAALGLSADTLWRDQNGRAFAGYAPVLAAIGQVLGKEKVPIRIQNALQQAGADQAWQVIERVAGNILNREQTKVTEPLAHNITPATVPPEAYDAEEQLTLLTDIAHGRTLSSLRTLQTGRLRFSSPSHTDAYQRMVRTHLADHPFLRHGQLVNEVLAAVVLSHGVAAGLIPDGAPAVIRSSSRQPFLWRSCQARLKHGAIKVEGRYVGYLLNSLWSDSLVVDPVVTITSDHTPDAAVLSVRVGAGTRAEWSRIEVTLPLVFYERLRDCTCRLAGDAVWQGHMGSPGESLFEIQGQVSFVADHLNIAADTVRIDGEARLRANEVEQLSLREVRTGRSAKVGLSGALEKWPWCDLEAVLKPPEALRPATRLERIIHHLMQSSGGTSTIYVYSGTKLPRDNDPKFSWVGAGKGREATNSEFQHLIGVLLSQGIASDRPTETNDRLPVSIVTFHDAWNRLTDALANSYEGQSVDDELKGVVNLLRSEFD